MATGLTGPPGGSDCCRPVVGRVVRCDDQGVKITLALVCAALAVAGCGRRHAPAESVAQLRSPDMETRRSAADDLRRGDGPPAHAVPAIMTALQQEKYPPAYGAMLITAGKSGVPDALPYICGAVQSDQRDMRRWGDRALDLWREKNRTFAAKGCPPRGMPVAMIVPAAPVQVRVSGPPPGGQPAPAPPSQ